MSGEAVDSGHVNDATSSADSGSRAASLKDVLAVARDFDDFGGTSLGLTSWEMGAEEAEIAPLWLHAVNEGLLRFNQVDEHGEDMWRLTDLGRRVADAAA